MNLLSDITFLLLLKVMISNLLKDYWHSIYQYEKKIHPNSYKLDNHVCTYAWNTTLVTDHINLAGFILLGCVHAYFAKAESAFWNADSKTPIQNAVNSGYCSSSSEPERRLYDVI